MKKSVNIWKLISVIDERARNVSRAHVSTHARVHYQTRNDTRACITSYARVSLRVRARNFEDAPIIVHIIARTRAFSTAHT